MIEIEYYNRSADHFYTRTFENNLSAVPFLREFPSADTVLVKLDDRELFMNNSEIVSVLKKGDFFYDTWWKCIVTQIAFDCDEKYRYILYRDNEEAGQE